MDSFHARITVIDSGSAEVYTQEMPRESRIERGGTLIIAGVEGYYKILDVHWYPLEYRDERAEPACSIVATQKAEPEKANTSWECIVLPVHVDYVSTLNSWRRCTKMIKIGVTAAPDAEYEFSDTVTVALDSTVIDNHRDLAELPSNRLKANIKPQKISRSEPCMWVDDYGSEYANARTRNYCNKPYLEGEVVSLNHNHFFTSGTLEVT